MAGTRRYRRVARWLCDRGRAGCRASRRSGCGGRACPWLARFVPLGEVVLRPLSIGQERRRYACEDYRNVVASAILIGELDELGRRAFECRALLVDDAVHDVGVDHV